MIELRPGQDRVAEFRNGYLAVPAVPGAGKTTVLAYLAAELIAENQGTQGKILIVTYMKSAVANFRSRIGDFLAEQGLPRNRGYEVRTLHSLALNILKEKPEFLLINDEFEIVDPAVRGNLLREVIDEWIQDNPRLFIKYFDYSPQSAGYDKALDRWRQNDFLRFISSLITSFKIKGLQREDIKKLQNKSILNSYLDWAFSIYKKYERLMHHQGYLDFDDLLNQAYQLLNKDNQLCQRLQNKYSYIFEDEAQDSNHLQEKILYMLAGESGNLVRVGDSNQAIMGTFTSADPEVFRSYADRDDVQTESILCSSRSSTDIIDLANHLVKWTVKEYPEPDCRTALEEKYIHPVADDDPYPNPQTEGYTLSAHTFLDSDLELQNIAQIAANHALQKPDNTQAILVPANYIIELLAEELEKYDVSYKLIKNDGSQEIKVIKKFITLINYLAEPHDINQFLIVLKEILLRPQFEEEKDLSFLDQLIENHALDDIIYNQSSSFWSHSLLKLNFDSADRKILKKRINLLKKWLEASVNLPPDELILLIAEQLKLNPEQQTVVQNMALQVNSERKKHPDWRLHEIAAEMTILEDSFRKFARRIYSRQEYEPEPGVINLSTVHKAKGLEWDTVYLMFLTDNYYPSTLESDFRAEHYYLEDEFSNPKALARARLEKLLGQKSKENPRKKAKLDFIAERIRLLYVGITRACKNLSLSAHRNMIFDNGNNKQVNEAQTFSILKEYINRKREQHGPTITG